MWSFYILVAARHLLSGCVCSGRQYTALLDLCKELLHHALLEDKIVCSVALLMINIKV